MAFVDEITLHCKAGRGGDGVVRWRREKGKDSGGPSGGNGGSGGNVYVVGVRDSGILAAYKNAKPFEAGDGEAGFKDSKHGSNGQDIFIKLPVGSRVKILTTGYTTELMEDGEEKLLLKGGRGGLGNEHFKSSTNVAPKQYTEGEEGEESDIHVELALIADVGLVGLPNAGKSSLLNALTNAKSKVGNFPFTTLDPSLGVFYNLILADIPGLIEGASLGKGLGHKFLKHIERTKGILHCISLESDDVMRDYEIVREELRHYNVSIANKPELIVLTKSDLVEAGEAMSKMALFKEKGKESVVVSVINDSELKALGDELVRHFK